MYRILALVILLAPLATANPWAATFQADSMQMQGTTNLSGDLLVFLQEDSRNEPPDHRIRLEAKTMRVEQDRTDLAIDAPPVYHAESPTTTVVEYRDASLRGLSVESGHRLNIYALDIRSPPILRTDPACARLEPSRSPEIERHHKVRGERPDATITRNVADASLWQACAPSPGTTIEGDLLLTVWAWDVEVEDASRIDRYDTGSSPRQEDHGPEALVRVTELYVYARGAILTIPPSGSSVAYVAGIESEVAGKLSLGGAKGTITQAAEEVNVQARTFLLEGDLQASVAAKDGGLGIRLTGEPRSGSIDGQQFELPQEELLRTYTWWPWVVALSAGLLLAGYLVPHWMVRKAETTTYFGSAAPTDRRQRRALGYWVLARRFESRGNLRMAILCTRLGGRLAPYFTDHAILRGMCRLQLGQYGQAYEDLHRADQGKQDKETKAINALELAGICVHLGRRQEAEAWMQKALRLHPSLRFDALDRPELKTLLPNRRPPPASDPAVM